MKLAFATGIVALTLPVLSWADIPNSTATLTAAMGALNLDAGTTGTSGGDLLWNGSTLTPQGSATAALAPVSGSDFYNQLTGSQAVMLVAQALNLSGADISAPAANAIILVHTNGGNSPSSTLPTAPPAEEAAVVAEMAPQLRTCKTPPQTFRQDSPTEASLRARCS